MIRFASLHVAVVGFLFGASLLVAQKGRPDACPSTPVATARTDAQKREARKVAEQARQAAIVDGSDAARALFKRSVELDPTDPNTVYALARSYDAAKESEPAMIEYCRFLALAPDAPEASDVRRKIMTLAEDVPRSRRDVAERGGEDNSSVSKSERGTAVRTVVPVPNANKAASNAGTLPLGTQRVAPDPNPPNDYVFALSPLVPGLGQYATHRPLLGALVTAASLGAFYMGLKPEYKTVTTVSTNPRGQPPRTTVTKKRPNLAAGTAIALGISTLAGVEAYIHGHGTGTRTTPAHRNTVVIVAPDGDAVGVGMSVAFR